MYEPRRVLGPLEAEAVPSPQPNAFTRPRRAALTWRDHVGQRAGIGLVTLAAVATSGALVLGGGPASAAVDLAAPPATLDRDAAPLSRSADRPAATLQVRQLSSSKLAEVTEDLIAVTPLFTTAKLNVRAKASSKADLVGSVPAGTKVMATSTIEGKYRKVTAGKLEGWVLASNLDDAIAAGEAGVAGGITMAKCSRGSGPEARLRPDTIRIYRSLCALFPGVNSYGGWRAGGRQFHKNGRALDIMLTPGRESALGWRIARYLIANARAFNVDHIIFEQKIWTPGSPRWRGMADRGGTTANHYDHVHVAIRG